MPYFKYRTIYTDGRYTQPSWRRAPSVGAFKNWARSRDRENKAFNSRILRTVITSILPICLLVFLVVKVGVIKK